LGAAGDEGKEGVGMKPWRGYHGFGKLGEGKREIVGKREGESMQKERESIGEEERLTLLRNFRSLS